MQLSPELVEHLSSIDGALMLGLDGVCYGIGIIVDGIAECYGSSSRGARYNSANTYVNYRNNEDEKKCVAIVISEDRTIDIIS